MENPRPNQPVMDIRQAPAPGYQIVENIPLRQPSQPFPDQLNPIQGTMAAGQPVLSDGGLDHILTEVNREVAKTTTAPKKASKFSLPKIYLHEVIAVITAAILIALTLRVYR